LQAGFANLAVLGRKFWVFFYRFGCDSMKVSFDLLTFITFLLLLQADK